MVILDRWLGGLDTINRIKGALLLDVDTFEVSNMMKAQQGKQPWWSLS